MSAGPDTPDWLERLTALQVEAQQLAARFAAALPADQRHRARDASGTVEVTVDGRGRVHQVRLRPDWRTRLADDGGLAKAIGEAVGNAQQERLSAFAAAVATGQPVALPPPVDTVSVPQMFGSGNGPAGPDAQRAMRETLHLIEAAERQLDDAVRQARENVRRQYTGHDPGRHITVRINGGGEFMQIEADERFLRRVRDDYIDRGLREAFAAAYRNADAAAASAEVTSGDAMRELKALTDNPNELLRRLFGDQ